MSPIGIPNTAAKDTPYFTPAQTPPSGTELKLEDSRQAVPKLFQPLSIRGVTFQNRIFVAPMCQYSADDGHMTAWHQAHLGGIFTRGPGLTIIEATAVLPEGRITPEDAGLWKDSQISPLKSIVGFAHSQGQKVGIQLAHAGRKASTIAPWLDLAAMATKDVGGWPDDVWGPGDEPWNERFAVPRALEKDSIRAIVEAFAAAAKRAVEAGIDVIEIHNAHGFSTFSRLRSGFLSPAVNKRTDIYGGSFENRIRLTVEVVDAIRAVIPEEMPLFLRVSGTDWLEESQPYSQSWTMSDTIDLAQVLSQHGVDLLDISSGGNSPAQRVPRDVLAQQAHSSGRAKRALGDKMLVSAVGGITNGMLAEGILNDGLADVILVGRHFQKHPGAVWQFADDLRIDIAMAHQIGWGFKGRPSALLGRSRQEL